MKLLVSHLSALRYWRSANELEVEMAKPCRIRSTARSASNVKQVRLFLPREHGLIMDEEHPLDILTDSSGGRRPAKTLAPHVWSGPIPTGAFSCIGDDIYLSTPEFVYLQLAGSLDDVELARLANELCGTYNLRLGERFTERSTPLTTKTRLANMVERSKGAFGSAKAARALRWVCNGSASPQETNLLLALCLPRRFGGYGLPLPDLNCKIEVGERLSAYIEGNYYYPDLMWKRKVRGRRVCVTGEYDSHENHDSTDEAERTRIRRNQFKTMRILVTSVNRSQMRDGAKFLYAARQIARDLGIWRPEPTLSEISDCDRLLRRLADERVG